VPRPKKYDSVSDKVQAWQAEKVDRIPLNIRRDAPVNKQVLQEAAEAAGMSLAKFLMEAAVAYILNHDNLGNDWLDEHKNKGDK